jgi:hypothetical protein
MFKPGKKKPMKQTFGERRRAAAAGDWHLLLDDDPLSSAISQE